EYHQAIGQVITEWANFEAGLILVFQAVSGNPDQLRARIAWATLPNLQARRKLLNRYAEAYIEDQEVLRKWRTLMKRMSSLANKRNMISHSPSGWNPDRRKVHFGRHH